MTGPEPNPVDPDPTSLHAHQARAGRIDSVQWLVQRFAPILLAHAGHRLGERLARVYDAQEIVADAWAAVLPRLAPLVDASEFPTTAVLGALSDAILQRTNQLLERHILGADGPAPVTESLDALPLATAGVITAACRKASESTEHHALHALPPEIRTMVLLRGVEQATDAQAAVQLGVDPATVTRGYARALQALRAHLPAAVFADLPDG